MTFPFKWGKKHPADEITCFSADKGFILWFFIIAGFVLSLLVRKFSDTASFCGWFWTWTLIYLVVTLIHDLNAKRLALWAVVFACIWFGLKYVENIKQVVIVGAITQHLANLNPQMDPGTASFVSYMFLIPFGYSLFNLFAYGRKRFSPNEIAEFHFLDGNELSDRMGMRFRTRYRDILETILTFGGGDIIAMDNHQKEIKRYESIIGLYFLWPRLERILNQRAVVETEEKHDD